MLGLHPARAHCVCTSGSIFTPPPGSAAGSVFFDAVFKLQKEAPVVAQSHHSQQFPKSCLRLLWPLCLPLAVAMAQPWSQGCPIALLPSSWASLISTVPQDQLPVSGSLQFPLLTNPLLGIPGTAVLLWVCAQLLCRCFLRHGTLSVTAVWRGKLDWQRHQTLFKLPSTFHTLLELPLLRSGYSHVSDTQALSHPSSKSQAT